MRDFLLKGPSGLSQSVLSLPPSFAFLLPPSLSPPFFSSVPSFLFSSLFSLSLSSSTFHLSPPFSFSLFSFSLPNLFPPPLYVVLQAGSHSVAQATPDLCLAHVGLVPWDPPDSASWVLEFKQRSHHLMQTILQEHLSKWVHRTLQKWGSIQGAFLLLNAGNCAAQWSP